MADVPFGVRGCDFLAFYNFQVDVSSKRLFQIERSEFEMTYQEKNGTAETANVEFELTQSPFRTTSTKSENETRPDEAHSSEPVSLNTPKAKTKSELEL